MLHDTAYWWRYFVYGFECMEWWNNDFFLNQWNKSLEKQSTKVVFMVFLVISGVVEGNPKIGLFLNKCITLVDHPRLCHGAVASAEVEDSSKFTHSGWSFELYIAFDYEMMLQWCLMKWINKHLEKQLTKVVFLALYLVCNVWKDIRGLERELGCSQISAFH